MAYGDGTQRLLAACLWAFFHFMNQPIYNSLLPEFLPVHRRSAGFGLSNLMGFGVGSLGPWLLGQFDQHFEDYTVGYLLLAVFALVAALLPLPILKAMDRSERIAATHADTMESDTAPSDPE